jgi:hypothetical protein
MRMHIVGCAASAFQVAVPHIIESLLQVPVTVLGVAITLPHTSTVMSVFPDIIEIVIIITAIDPVIHLMKVIHTDSPSIMPHSCLCKGFAFWQIEWR